MKLAIVVVLFAVVSLAYSEPQQVIRQIHFTIGGAPGGAAKSSLSGLGGAAKGAKGTLGGLGGGPGGAAKGALGGHGG